MPNASNRDRGLTSLERSRVVVVGASLAGLRSVDSILRAGYSGEVILIGDERHPPYNRPPLSKEALSSSEGFDAIKLRSSTKPDSYKMILGVGARALQLEEKTVILEDDTLLEFDGLVVATGLRSRALAIPKPKNGIFSLRSFDDLEAIKGALIRAGMRIAIIGAGFIGAELAGTLTNLGHMVTIVAPEEVLMQRPLGNVLGGAIGRHHRERGVELCLGRLPLEIESGSDGFTLYCDDGTIIRADLVIEAIGSIPNVEWMQQNGLDLGNGVLCDETLRFGHGGANFAVGDVARFPNLAFDEVPRRIEHWGIAVDSGRYLGKAMVSLLTSGTIPTSFKPMPAFWSDQFDLRIQSFGIPGLVVDPSQIRILEGDIDTEVAMGYFQEETMVGVVLIGLGQSHMKYRDEVEKSLKSR